ncbi:MAG TPA: hypothetical protein VE781_17650 [Kineosporiaceae bacterium]|nr:hypothetical protein [Kineosporiaceae bacterium]
MSTTSELPTEHETVQEPQAEGFKARLNRHRTRLVVAAAVIGVLGGTAAAWVSTRQTPAPSPITPISLPDSVAGLANYSGDPMRGANWQEKASQALGTTAFSAKSYGAGGTGKTIRVVAARTDLTGKLELAWPAGNGEQVGDVTCTHNARLTPTSQPRTRPTLLICWRTSKDLSAYAMILDPKATSPIPNAEGAAAVTEAWHAAGGS